MFRVLKPEHPILPNSHSLLSLLYLMRSYSRKFVCLAVAGFALLGGTVWYLARQHGSTSAAGHPPAEKVTADHAAKARPIVLQTAEEIQTTANAHPCDRTVLTYLDLSRPPTQAELIAAGNLGEPLTPTRPAEPADITDPVKRARMEQENLDFGTAIQAWNQHRYPEAYALFEKHLADYKDSPWAAEAQLHLGCFCQYNGRLTESAESFDGILSTVAPKSEMYNKAKLRRSILHLDQGDLEASLQGFTEMKRDDLDPRHQSYASYWIREIALLKKNETALRDCGQKSLARVAEIHGSIDTARHLRETVSAGPHGFTAEELHATALLNGLDSRPVHADTALDDLPVPFVAHYLDRHYVTVERVTGDLVSLFDSRSGETTMPRKSFLKQWSGFALIFSEPAATAAIYPADHLDTIVGGCCGHPRSPSDLGDNSCNKHCGLPGWSVNPVNFNFRVSDTPMWWQPPVGPSVSMSLLFNSLDSLNNYESFGEKWSFNYASYLLITPGGQVQVKDGDGRLETFTAGSAAGTYPVTRTSPPGDFRVLAEVADHVFTLTHQDGTIYNYGVPSAMAGTSSVPLLLSIEDRHGNNVSVSYNAQGAITAIKHSMLPALTPSGGGSAVTRKWVFTYGTINGHSRVVRLDDPFGRNATFGYDNDGNLTNQTDMGGLTYGYDYTTKTSQDTISTNFSQTGSFAAPTNELFISAIHTPKGDTNILTEPSDGQSPTISGPQAQQGYSSAYPPIGTSAMLTNYRIRITNAESKTEEYHFDGSADGAASVYHRDPIQLNRPAGQSVAPADGACTYYQEWIVGGVKGKIKGVSLLKLGGYQDLSATYYSDILLKPTAITGANGYTTYYEYYDNGTLKTLKLPKTDGTATDPYQIHYTYQANGLDVDKIQRYLDGTLVTVLDIDYWPGTRDVMQTTDALSHITSYTWKTNGLPASVTDGPTGDSISYVYDQGSNDADGDPTWRLLKVKLNNTVMSQVAYDAIGRPVMQLDPAGDYVQSAYDGLNRLTRTDRSDSSYEEQIWECCFVGETRSGKVVGGQDSVKQRIKFFHDHRGLPVKSIDTAGKITQLGYDDAGRMITLTDPMNRVTSWNYDDFGRIDKKTYPDNSFEQITWYNMEKPYKFKNRRGQEASFDFDADGNLRSRTISDAQVYNTYDGWDRLKTTYDYFYNPNGNHVYTYDLLGRVTSLDGPWSDDTISYAYNDATRSVTRTSPGGVATTTVADTLGRIASIANPLGTFTSGYDGDTSRLLSITHSGGFNTALSYYGPELDRALNTLTSTLPGGGGIGKHTYGYDAQGRISSWQREATLANPSGTTRSFQWTSSYDFASQLTSVSEKSLTGTLQGGWDYGFDPAGNITSVQASSGSSNPSALTKRSHNSLNQLTTLGGGGTTLVRGTLSEPGQVSVGLAGGGQKAARMIEGNRFETELPLQTGANSLNITAVDGSNNRSNYSYAVQVAPQQAQAFTYDAEGNLTSDGTRSYEWDSLSRLTKITWAIGKTTQFKYNALGQRSDRIDTDGSSVTNHYYLFDGAEMLDHRTGTTANTAPIDRRYFSQGEQRKNGSTWENYIYCRDHLGSIREVVKSAGSTNTLVARYDYDPYGKRLTQYEAAAYAGGCDFGFTGHITLPSLSSGQTEMVLTLFRAYDPQLGRWLSADPIGEAGGLNLYAYVGGNPINAWDDLGLWQITIFGGTGLGGYFTIGKNSGQWNFGLRGGIGGSISASWDPSDSGCRPSGLGAVIGGDATVGSGKAIGGAFGGSIDSKQGDTFYFGGRIYKFGSVKSYNNPAIYPLYNPHFTESTSNSITNYGASGFLGFGISYAGSGGCKNQLP